MKLYEVYLPLYFDYKIFFTNNVMRKATIGRIDFEKLRSKIRNYIYPEYLNEIKGCTIIFTDSDTVEME